jgi:hypothetical protein
MPCPSCGHQNVRQAPTCAACGQALDAAAPVAVIDDEAWATVVGPARADDYLDRFSAFWDGGRRIGWHWPALFCTTAWLLYRKMWRWAAVYALLLPVVYFGLGFTVWVFHWTGLFMRIVFGVVGTLLFVVGPPMVAVDLYRRHCGRIIGREAARGGHRNELLARLTICGGTSLKAVVVAATVLAAAAVVWTFAIAMPSYRAFVVRGRMEYALDLGMGVAEQVGMIYQRTGRIPISAADLPARPVYPDYVELIKIYQQPRVVEVLVTPTQAGQEEIAGSIFISGEEGPDRKLVWSCSVSEPVRAYAPGRCRRK